MAGAQDYEMSRQTIDGGGVTESVGGDFELSGTIGQPDAGILAGGDFSLTGGFWFPVAPGDCNTDGGVNLYDLSDVEECLSGPEGGPVPVECACLDFDCDGDVDLSDVAQFQKSFSGGGE
jgi:hypothetical protein